MDTEERCACESGMSYSTCCFPFHDGAPAPTAIQLMRSRYSAYALQKIDYLVNTTHTSTRKDHPYEAIQKWAKQTTWKGLEIVHTKDGMPEDYSGVVEFKATYNDGESKDEILHEASNFLKEEGHWFYVDGNYSRSEAVSKKVGRNDPCICGSGKKFKKCCG